MHPAIHWAGALAIRVGRCRCRDRQSHGPERPSAAVGLAALDAGSLEPYLLAGQVHGHTLTFFRPIVPELMRKLARASALHVFDPRAIQ